MSRVRGHLTFENILVTVVAFVVLAGGSAIAAGQLGKNSVGKKQLRANAVTTAKIKKNAVTRGKIRNGAVDGAKVKDGSLTVADLEQASMPFGRVVHEAHSTGPPSGLPVPLVPLDQPAYTQEAGRDDSIVGAADVNFPPGCEPPRFAVVYAMLDATDPSIVAIDSAVAAGIYQDQSGTGPSNVRINVSPISSAGPLSPAAPVNHTLSALGGVSCKGGLQLEGISNVVFKVIGVK